MSTPLQDAQAVKVALPGKAPDADSGDVLGPAVLILRALNLLPQDEQNGFGQAFTGPPDSVSLLEAGVTAASKWWSIAGAAAVATLWGSVVGFWDKQPEGNQHMFILGAAIATAAIVLAIGYLLASDVRGRAAAMVATIEARARVAQSVVDAAHVAAESARPTAPAETDGTAHDDGRQTLTTTGWKQIKFSGSSEDA